MEIINLSHFVCLHGLLVYTMCHTEYEEIDTKNIGKIIVGALCIPTHNI